MLSLLFARQSDMYRGFGGCGFGPGLTPACASPVSLHKLSGFHKIHFCHLKHHNNHDFL